MQQIFLGRSGIVHAGAIQLKLNVGKGDGEGAGEATATQRRPVLEAVTVQLHLRRTSVGVGFLREGPG